MDGEQGSPMSERCRGSPFRIDEDGTGPLLIT